MKQTVFFSLLQAGLLFAGSAFAQTLKVDPVANPSAAGSSQVNWSVTQDGNPLLSWVEATKDGSFALRYAVRKGNDWSEARTIAAKRHFFHHPAEVPGVVALPNGTLIAHWIEQPSETSEAEFVWVSASHDGVKWTEPAMASHDKSQNQHGLASMIASGPDEASLFWLQALKGEDGPVSLMRSVISANGTETKEETLDSDVCSCCPTSVVKTPRGLLVVYRDHTKDNIRDISVTRLEGGRWTSPKNVYPDKWQIDACPVNAASASAKGDKVAIAWYTASGDKPRVEYALSSDSGATFTKALVISAGQSYGYTSTAIDDAGGAYVSWLEHGNAGNARLMVRHISDTGTPGAVAQVVEGPRKELGYPRLLRAGNDLWIAWNTTGKIQTARLK
jgi:BNR repeat-like domain